jgi:hypothetical protein
LEPAAPADADERAGGGAVEGRAGDGVADVPGDREAMPGFTAPGVTGGRPGPAWVERSGAEIPTRIASTTATTAATASTRPSVSTRRTPEA